VGKNQHKNKCDISLPHQYISVNVLLADVKTIGGLRIGLYGDQYINESYT